MFSASLKHVVEGIVFRIVERDRLEKLAKEKDIVTKKTTARKKLRKLAVRRSESSSLE